MNTPRFNARFCKFNLCDFSQEDLVLRIFAGGKLHQIIFHGDRDTLEWFKDDMNNETMIGLLIENIDIAIGFNSLKLGGHRKAKWEEFKSLAEKNLDVWDYQIAINQLRKAEKALGDAEDMITDVEFNLPIWTDGERVDCLWCDLLNEWKKQPMIGPEPNYAHMIAA